MSNSAYARKFPSIYRGIVEDNKDPENRGRCKVRVPFMHGELTYSPSLLPWARQVSPFPINERRGISNVPDIGDIVWVLFEGADKSFPVYFGGTYGSGDVKATTDKVVIYTEDGNSIEYSDGVYKITVGDNLVSVGSDEITLSNESNSVTVSKESVTIDSPTVNIKGNLNIEGSVNSTGQSFTVDSLHVNNKLEVDEDILVSGKVSVGNDMNISGCCNRDNGSLFCSCIVSEGGDLS